MHDAKRTKCTAKSITHIDFDVIMDYDADESRQGRGRKCSTLVCFSTGVKVKNEYDM